MRNLIHNKKGLTNQFMIIMILFIVIVCIIGIFFIAALIGPVIVQQGTILTSTIQNSIHTSNPDSSLDNATQVATSSVQGVFGIVEFFIYLFLIAMFIGFLVVAYFVRTYPILSILWIVIIVALAFISMIFSNYYETVSAAPNLDTYYTTWGTNHYLMTNLPIIVIVFGVVSGILLFIIASREPETEVFGLN